MEHEESNLKHETWQKAFKMVELENTLSNHRVTMIMIINGFLFIAFLYGVDCLIKIKLQAPSIQSVGASNILLRIVLSINSVICVVGAMSSWTIKQGIYAAYMQIIEAKIWLEEVSGNKEKLIARPYPPMTGKKPSKEEYESVDKLCSGNLLMPKILTYVWVSFLVVDLYLGSTLHTM